MPTFRATYRLQLTPDFGFAAAARTVPYLRSLGISHLYLSPSLQAVTGSTHGYDVVDPSTISRDLGGETGFRKLAATAREAGLGIVLDIVPNHMAADDSNPWWADEQTRAEVFDYDPESGWYRRFFDVDGLAGVRQEDPSVFQRTHAKVFELLDEGLVDGLRIDHPDGLADPAGYLERLRDRGARHVWIEKILHHGEPLRNWPVEGTTGYEFLTDVTTAFVDPDGEGTLTEAYQQLTGDTRPFSEVAREARLEQATTTFAREVEQLRVLGRRKGIVEALADLPLYRTYIDVPGKQIDDLDRQAFASAGLPEPLVSLLTSLRPSSAEFVTRFQQTTPPVVAKGVEDTALYRSVRLLALNDVGGDPGRFSMTVDELHQANLERQARFPRAMLAATTHDTKRSADTRARLTALAGQAEQFVEHARRWFEITEPLVDGGAPSPAERWFLFQTLLGAWPITADRLDAYVEKALREAKVTTSWIDPDLGWEARVKAFARELLVHPGFVADFQPYAEVVARAGEQISVAQTVLRTTVPGMPDTYQGDETWFLGLVDPDNRRPLDWAGRHRALEGVRRGRPPTRANHKLHVLHHTLELRRQLPDTFAGPYTPLDAGPGTLAFLRGDADVLVVVPIRRSRAQVEVPSGPWVDVLNGGTTTLRRRMPVTELTRRQGVAVFAAPVGDAGPMSDAVVIGSGPNGLVAANLLADRGWSVTVLESQSTPGGAVRSAELIEPGFVNDVCSAFYPLSAASPTIQSLHLEGHGLRWCHTPTVLAHPTRDGTCPVISRDIDVTVASLDALHAGDGSAWRDYYGRWAAIESPLLDTILSPFPPVMPALRIATSMSPKDLLRLTRFTLLPVRRMGEEEFAGEAARRLIAGAALHADFSPEATLSGMFGWLMCGLAQSVGFPVPEGGAGAFSGALVRRLESKGGHVQCDSAVRRIVVRGGRAVAVQLAGGDEVSASRAVLADVNAPLLYRRLVGAEHLPADLMKDLDRFHWDDATVKVDWNLDGPIPWTSEAARLAGTVHVAEGVDALTLATSEMAHGLVPARPFLLMGQQSMTDPTRQPAGSETAWAYTHVPRRIKGDAGATEASGKAISPDWTSDDAERMADRIEAEVEALAPGFRALIRGRHVLTPPRFEAENPNLDGAAINGGTAQLHQQLVFRPVPGFGRPETPIKGLYLASGSAHPGGGVHGAAGANAAKAALGGERIRSLQTYVKRRSPRH